MPRLFPLSPPWGPGRDFLVSVPSENPYAPPLPLSSSSFLAPSLAHLRLHGDSPPQRACIQSVQGLGSRAAPARPAACSRLLPSSLCSQTGTLIYQLLLSSRVCPSGAPAPPAAAWLLQQNSLAPSRSPASALSTDWLPTASSPCRGLPCQSFPFVTGLANRRVLGLRSMVGGGGDPRENGASGEGEGRHRGVPETPA